MTGRFFAHSLKDQDKSSWELLLDHLKEVAQLAAGFAQRFGAEDWGELLGRWHDLGKYQPAFQSYLDHANGFEAHLETLATGKKKVDHSTPGAEHAFQVFQELEQPYVGMLLAYCIAGHHAGLPDWTDDAGNTGLKERFERIRKAPADLANVPEEIRTAKKLAPPPLRLENDPKKKQRTAFQIAFFCRMLFSCLVDADFLATEGFMDKEKSRKREAKFPALSEMKSTLDAYLANLAKRVEPTDVNICRQEVLAACRAAANQPPGLFSLSVPTGGGKTLASLAFALDHAAAHPEHAFGRVIYAIPFTSIIEQTVNNYKKVFDSLNADIVLEHHSNLDPDEETRRQRLMAENWNAPLVVTTNVQLFESLFAARTSRCRKLHRLARSIIILDEAQTLPVELLEPCLAALDVLAKDYGATIVLCTATQPAITAREDFSIGLKDVCEIIPDREGLYRRMKRVETRHIGQMADEELFDRLKEHEQFLTIVNTRAHAARLFEELRKTSDREGLFHLSTRMCGDHRAGVIDKIHERLKHGKPCRVISTQLIEAGVDVDFPVVFRAISGLDSIAQAAGRCNREGKRESGLAYIFETPDIKLRGLLGSTANTTRELLPDLDGDLLSLEAVQSYFKMHYWKQEDVWDKHGILNQFIDPFKSIYQFRTAAKLFRMIEDASQTLIVPWEKGNELIEELMKDEPPDWKIRRRLQRYTVPVFDSVFNALVGKDIEVRHESFAVLLNEDMYDDEMGFRPELEGYLEPESSVL
jgi:CRISPR-associated endonuclease/helicase Cas3